LFMTEFFGTNPNKVEQTEIGLTGRASGNAFDVSAVLAVPPGSPS